jgi:PKD repeat protein
LAALALSFVACGRHESPTQPSSTSELGTAQLTVKIDGADSAVAIASVSEATFEARTSGNAVHYDIQFGDGQSASTATASHVYEQAGTFTAALTVTDAAGRRESISRTVVVKTVEGTWFHLGYNEKTRSGEFHRLTIATQEGTAVRGVYTSLGAGDRPLVGTLGRGRTVRLRADYDGLEFEGTVPSAILAENQPWSLRGIGGSVDGLTMPFRGVIGEPTGPGPDTRIDIRWDESLAWRPVMGLTSIKYDVTRSTGDGMSYVIEYGDGDHTTDPSSFHKSNHFGDLVIRLVAADRFGRVKVTTTPLTVVSLRDGGGSRWYNAFLNPVTQQYEGRALEFRTHEGNSVTGSYWHPGGGTSNFHGVLSGDNRINLSLDLGGIEFSGTIALPNTYYTWRMHLLFRGGSADGATLDFVWDDGPG